MSNEPRRLFKLGGAAFIAGGIAFLATGVLEYVAGPPPATGAAILAWVEANKLALAFGPELLFFATMTLVPAVVALHQSLASSRRAAAATGCGIIAAVVPVLAMLLIIQGRLVYPVYGLRVDSPAIAELMVALYYGGLHAVYLLMAVATLVLGVAMRRSVYGPWVAHLGLLTSVVDVAAAYPDLIGAGPTLAGRAFFAAWFVAVGARLRRIDHA